MRKKIMFGTLLEQRAKIAFEKGQSHDYVGMEDIQPGRRFVISNTRKEYKGGTKFENGDVLLARITPCLENGKIAQFVSENEQPAFGSTEFFVFRAKQGVNQSYIFYLASSDLIRKPAKSSMTGASGRQRADLTAVLEAEIPELTHEEQNKVDDILSPIDSLIENSTKRIKILEGMARLIYREWFVHYRFPNHEKVKMVDSGTELGEIPEEWSVKAASEAIEINPRSRTTNEGFFVSMDGLSTSSMLISNIQKKETSSGAKYRNGDTLFARITPCLENGKTGFVQFLPTDETVGCGSTEFIVLRSKSLTPEFVYLLARQDDFRKNAEQSMTGASGRQRVKPECFDKYLLANPDEQTLQQFTEIVRPMFRLIQNLGRRNDILRRSRDLLLPKLISGQLTVS